MTKTKMWVQTEGDFLVLLALMLLLLPLQWVFAVIMSVFIHELCHYIALRLLGCNVYGLRLGFRGAIMEVEHLPPHKELITALAGPIGSALLVLLVKWMPRVAICGFVHCVFNLLPLFPMDGGRALHGLFTLCVPNGSGERGFFIFQRILRWSMGILCVFVAFQWGIVPAILAMALIWRQGKKRTV